MRKIVIIEDNLAVSRLFESKLKAAGNTVYTALDGVEGLKLIHETRPDLVLLDLLLPNKSGIEIIREIRKDYRFTNVPIMAYSSADEDILTQAVEAGSTTIISKNEASFKEILEHFKALMETSRKWQIYDPSNFDGNEHSENESARSSRLLIVEDDPITSRIVSSIAEKEELAALVIGDGQEALRLLASESDFAAAVIDIELPKIKGTDLLKYMRSEKRLMHIPVVVMTSSTDYIKLQIESYKSGATFFISKPFERAVFESLLKNLVRK